MNSSDSENSSFIETELKDILTLDSCTCLLSELIKFILYRKQQLPYTFDRLKYLVTKRNSKKIKENTNAILSSAERQFQVAENGLATLELLFKKTREELADPRKGCISQVALLFGSTPMTPKQVYIIHLPEVCLDHSGNNHPERKHLLLLLQSVIFSNNFTNMLTKPMNPTNMFVFIKKNRTSNDEIKNNLNQWFIPKNRYEIPRIGQQFHIKFRHPDSVVGNCKCQNFKIYSDEEGLSSMCSEFLENDKTPEKTNNKNNDWETKWYQACEIFKGFTDVYINGVSVADLWLR